MFNGLNMRIGNLYQLSNVKTRSICLENFTVPDKDYLEIC